MQIQRLCFYKQIDLFKGTQELITRKIGMNESRKFFQEARYVVALGSNDFINNYLMPVYSDSWRYNDDSFLDYLVGTFRDQLKVILILSNVSKFPYFVCIYSHKSLIIFKIIIYYNLLLVKKIWIVQLNLPLPYNLPTCRGFDTCCNKLSNFFRKNYLK